MTTFKEFLVETAVKQKPKYRRLSMEEAIKLLKTKCKNNLWMVEENTPLYRGDYPSQAGMPDFDRTRPNVYVVDTASAERKSTNTENFYTEIFDTHPKMKAFPKRSRSFICSTYRQTAVGYGTLFAIIPFDDAKVAFVGAGDMWDIGYKFEIFNRHHFAEMHAINRLFVQLLNGAGINSYGLKGLQRFGQMLKKPDSPARKVLFDVINSPGASNYGKLVDGSISDEESEKLLDLISKDFIKYIYDCYDPSVTGFSLGVTHVRSFKDSEAWVGGNVIMFERDAWDELRKAFGRK